MPVVQKKQTTTLPIVNLKGEVSSSHSYGDNEKNRPKNRFPETALLLIVGDAVSWHSWEWVLRA